MVAAVAEAKPVTIVGDACDPSALDAELAPLFVDKTGGAVRVSLVTRTDRSLGAEVLFVDDAGTQHGPRVVTAPSCEELIESIALVVAMAMPDAEPGEEKVAAPVPTPAVVLPPSEAPSDELSGTRTPSRALAFDGYVGVASSITSTGQNQQFLLGARVKRGRGSLALHARLDAPESIAVSVQSKITVTHADLALAPCAHVGAFAGCALLSAGFVHGSGDALYAQRDVYAPVLAAGGRIAWEPQLTRRLALRIHLDGRALVTTTTFAVDFMPVWKSSRIEASGGVGLLARFL